MKMFFNYLIAALIGGFGYCLIEIIYRGRTHYSMFFAGAIVLSTFYYISTNYQLSIWAKCLIGMLIITAVELVFGIAFNIILKEHVWDYSNVPLNFLGQICLPFSLIWFVLSGIAFKVLEKI
ncbi:MAG: putative ABC transporter permease [Eubacterium sp.]|nr:putative ABC transporter permease [Eubacterium sp.]MDE6767430.1 putative ABC transporter permease [Eubacterium sp.]